MHSSGFPVRHKAVVTWSCWNMYDFSISYVLFHLVSTSCFNFLYSVWLVLWASLRALLAKELWWKYVTMLFTLFFASNTSGVLRIESFTTRFNVCAKQAWCQFESRILFKNKIMSTFLGLIADLFWEISSLALENNLSLGTEVAVIPNTSLAMRASLGVETA